MDRLQQIKIVRETLQAFISLPDKHYPLLREVLVVDEQQQHFILSTIGWDKKRFMYDTTFHLELTPANEVWIHQNNTDLPIGEILTEKGIAKAAIKVSAFIEGKMPLAA